MSPGWMATVWFIQFEHFFLKKCYYIFAFLDYIDEVKFG